jgi:hypothetical protein
MVNQVAIRLGTTGKSEVRRDFDEVRASGQGAMKGIADGARLAGETGEREARRLSAAYDRASADIEAADRRRAAAAAKLAMVSAQTPLQARIGASVGTGYGDPNGTAKQSAIVFAQLIAQQEQLEQRAHAFRAAMDPAYAAQARFNTEMAEAKTLIGQSAISLDEYCNKLRQERMLLDQAQSGHRRVNAATGEARAGMQQLTMQLNDAATMWAMGSSAQQIFVSQSGQVIQAVQLMSGGTSKFATFMGGPWGAAITVGTIVLVPFVAKMLEGEKAIKAAEFASDGLKDAQGILGTVMDLTTGKINTQSQALHGLAQAQALAMEVEARSRLAVARRTLQGARDPQWYLEGGMGGGVSVGTRRSEAAGVVTRFQDGSSWHGGGAGALTGKQAVQRLNDLLQAKKISEREFLDVSAAIANFGLEQENVSRAQDLDKALNGDRTALNQFLTPKTNKPKTPRDKVTDAERAAKARAEFIKDTTADLGDQIDLSEREFALVGATEQERSKAIGILQFTQQLKRQNIDAEGAEGQALIAKKNLLLNNQQELNRARSVEGYDRQFRDAIELADEEGRLIGLSNAERERTLMLLRLKQTLDRDGIDAESEQGKQILANNEALARKNDWVRRQAESWQEVQNAGENFIDTVFDVSNWNDWGDIGKRVLNDLMNDMIRLAAINPLKNLLFGGDLPTLAGVVGSFGNGMGSAFNKSFDATFAPKNASGTEYFSGGATYLSENGPELVELPRGSKINNAANTRRMMANDNPAPVIHIDASIHAPGADAAALARVEANQQEMVRSLPGQVVQIVSQAMSDRVIR